CRDMRSVPPQLAERIHEFASLELVKGEQADVRLVSHESLNSVSVQSASPRFLLVVLDNAESYLGALATVRFRVDETTFLRAKTRCAREQLENTELQYSGLVYLGAA